MRDLRELSIDRRCVSGIERDGCGLAKASPDRCDGTLNARLARAVNRSTCVSGIERDGCGLAKASPCRRGVARSYGAGSACAAKVMLWFVVDQHVPIVW